MASEGLSFLFLSLIPNSGCEEMQQHLLAPGEEGGPGSVSQGTVFPCPPPVLCFAPGRAEAQHLQHRVVDGCTQEIVFTNTLVSPQLPTCSRNSCSEIMALECLQFILT